MCYNDAYNIIRYYNNMHYLVTLTRIYKVGMINAANILYTNNIEEQ